MKRAELFLDRRTLLFTEEKRERHNISITKTFTKLKPKTCRNLLNFYESPPTLVNRFI